MVINSGNNESKVDDKISTKLVEELYKVKIIVDISRWAHIKVVGK